MRRYTFITDYRKMDAVNLLVIYIALFFTLRNTIMNDYITHSIVLGIAFSLYTMRSYKVLPTIVYLFTNEKVSVNTAGRILDVLLGVSFLVYMVYLWTSL